jgi:sirohydrochlorin ferrochelatase
VSRYREMAEHTHALAERVQNPDLREAYLELAGRWRALAESTQRNAENGDLAGS